MQRHQQFDFVGFLMLNPIMINSKFTEKTQQALKNGVMRAPKLVFLTSQLLTCNFLFMFFLVLSYRTSD